MPRRKFLLWVLLVYGLVGANLVTVATSFERSVSHQLDARLAAAAEGVLAHDVSIQSQRAAALARAGQDPALLASLKEAKKAALPSRAAVAALASALAANAGRLDKALAAPGLVAIVNDQGTARQIGTAEMAVSEQTDALPAPAAAAAFPLAVWFDVGDAPYRVFAFPARAEGEKPRERTSVILVAGFPLDEAYAQALAKVAGAAVTVAVDDKVLASSLPASGGLRAEMARAARAATGSFAIGQTRAAVLGPLGLPVLTVPRRPWDLPPAFRGRGLPVEGLANGRLAVAMNLESSYAALAEYQVRYLPGAVGVLALCLAFLLWLGPGAPAAARAERRAPARPRTAESSTRPQPAATPPLPPTVPSPAVSEAASPLPPLPEASPGDFGPSPPGGAAFPASPEASMEAAPADADPFASMGGDFAPAAPDPFSPTPMREDRFQPAARSSSEEVTRGASPDPFEEAAANPAEAPEYAENATVVSQVPEHLIRASARPAARTAAPPASPEEAHFQDVFREFVATREKCGEPADGLTFEKFAAKLRKNKEQLVAKYNCKTVRFQVYVKDGKAALKATPVRE